MSNYSSIKATINANIKANNNQEITGNILNSVLQEMVNNLAAGYLFKGVATSSTNPGTPDEKVFYIGGAGNYTYFGGAVIPIGYLGVFYYDTAWHTATVEISLEIIDNLLSEATDQALSANMGRLLKSMIGDVHTTGGSATEVEFSLNGYYGAGQGFIVNTVNNSTPLIPLANAISILYTGSMGGTVATWFDENQQYLSQTTSSAGVTLVDQEIMTSRPTGAKFVQLATRNSSSPNPPSSTPRCVVTRGDSYIPLQEQIDETSLTPDSIPIDLPGYYNSSGSLTSASTNLSSDKIELAKYKRLVFSGAGNGILNWWTANGSFIGQTFIREIIGGDINSFEPNAAGLEVKLYAPSNAAYVGISVRNSTYSPAPIATSSLLGYKNADNDFVRFGVIADGKTDTTATLQNLLNSLGSEISFPRGTYLISDSLVIKPGIVKRLNGNGAIIKTTQDVPAFIISGSLGATSSADPSSLSEAVISTEASIVVDGFVFTSSNSTTGTAIQLSNVFEPIIQNCYIHHIKNGIEIANRCRNIIIANNNIYCCSEYGLLFAENSNCHQANIVGNHISYCHCCLGIIQTQQTANLQIVGNDIEIATWPSSNRSTSRCMVIDYQNTDDPLCSEFEIVGNTIQGHEYSNGLIDITGVAGGLIENLSLSGNQISNVNGYAVKLAYVHNFSCGGNTFRRVSGKVYSLLGTINGLVISGEVSESGTGFVNADSAATIYALTLSSLTGRSMSGGIGLSCTQINGLVVIGCNIASSTLTVAATTLDYVSITGNILRGTYNIGSCTHKVVENNI